MTETPDLSPRPLTFGPLEPSLLALRGIRLFDGENGAGGGGDGGDGSGDDGGNDDGGQGADGDDGDGDSQQQKPTPKPKPTARRSGPETFSREYVSELRTENGQRRQNETKLTGERDALRTENGQLKLEVSALRRNDAVRGAAEDGGGNARALLDSSSFQQAISEVDLSDRNAVVEAIKTFVKDNPFAAAVQPGPGSSGPGRPGGARTGAADTSNSLAGAVGAALGSQGA